MSIEFIGIAATQAHTETEIEKVADGPVVNAEYLRALAKAHEDAGFDRVLVAHSSASPDGFIVADQVLTGTDRLGVLLAHRPGFVAPTLAARNPLADATDYGNLVRLVREQALTGAPS
jgi:alkanesulfonate monooxygenase